MSFEILQLVCSVFVENGSKGRSRDEGWRKITDLGLFINESRFCWSRGLLHASAPVPVVKRPPQFHCDGFNGAYSWVGLLLTKSQTSSERMLKLLPSNKGLSPACDFLLLSSIAVANLTPAVPAIAALAWLLML